MNDAWRHRMRRARFLAGGLAAGLVIALAVAMGLLQLLLPLATRYPDFVARQLSGRLHRPVAFSAIRSEWQPSGPLLTVQDLTLGPARPGGASISLPHAALKFDFGAWLRPSHRWITLRLRGMNLRVDHDAGGWRIAGFASDAHASHASLQSLPVDLDLRDLRVTIVDQPSARTWTLLAPRLVVVNAGDTARFAGTVQQLGTRQAASVVGQVDADTRDYDLYLATHGLDLAAAAHGVDLHGYTVRAGHADVELWGRWRAGRVVAASTRYALRGIDLAGPAGRQLGPVSFGGVARAVQGPDGWRVAWRGPGKPGAGIDDAGGAVALVTGGPGHWGVTAAVRNVDADPWLAALAMLPQAPGVLGNWVAEAAPGVRIDAAALAWRQQGGYDLDARFSGLHAKAADRIPGIVLARGRVRADARAVSLQLPQQPATFAITDVFRKPFEFKAFQGQFTAWREAGGWHLAADDLRFDGGGFAGRAHATLAWPEGGGKPFVSAYAVVDHAKVVDAKQFWPWRSMPASLVAWLDHALVSGDVTGGRVLLRGDLDHWPFVDGHGRFEATGTVKDATFDFADDWPRATGVDAEVDFVDNSMDIVASHVQVREVTVRHASASIPDLDQGVLGLDVDGNDSGPALLDFVRHSPVGADALDALDGLSVGGSGKFKVQLSIPLDDPEQFQLAGKVDLAGADVAADKWKLALDDVSGPLVLAGHGFHTDGLQAKFRGAPATLAMAVGDNVADPRHLVEASLDTRVSPQALVQDYPDLHGLVAQASGTAPFHVGVEVTAGTAGAPASSELSVTSPLQGVALAFPAPLAKRADTRLPFTLKLQLPLDGARLSASLGNVLQVRGRLADAAHGTPAGIAVAFGAQPPASVPASGLVAGGHAASLDLSGWIQQALSGSSGSGFPSLQSAHVSTDDAEVFGTRLGALDFDFAAGADHDTVRLDGPAVKGSIELATRDLATRGIRVDLDRLYWPEPEKPASEGPPVAPPVTSPVPPMLVPPLHVAVADLRLGQARLGTVGFESAPTLAGMHIARFEARNSGYTLSGQGDWNGGMRYSQSRFTIDLASKDFGKTLAAFGFDGMLAGGADSRVHLDGTWPGPPSSFSLGWMTGSLSLHVGEGRVLAVKPGLGRLLGLLSLRELPSRLTLHFGDVFKSGFGFDEAAGNFALQDGNATTADLRIKAPAAQIAMHGRIGFRAHDYDMLIDVTPHVGVALPVVGAVLGGPVGAAAGLAVQGLVGKRLNRAAGSAYQVTGSWEKPNITALDSVPAAAASAAPAASASVPPDTTLPPPAASVAPAVAGSVPVAAGTGAPLATPESAPPVPDRAEPPAATTAAEPASAASSPQ